MYPGKMSKKALKFITLSLFLTAFALFACSKANTFIRILGTWTRVNVVNLSSQEYEEWRFDVDDVLLIRGYSKTYPDSVMYTYEGRYHVGVNLTKRFIDISGYAGGLEYMNDRWDIVKSNNNILIIVSGKQGGLVIREFTKKKI